MVKNNCFSMPTKPHLILAFFCSFFEQRAWLNYKSEQKITLQLLLQIRSRINIRQHRLLDFVLRARGEEEEFWGRFRPWTKTERWRRCARKNVRSIFCLHKIVLLSFFLEKKDCYDEMRMGQQRDSNQGQIWGDKTDFAIRRRTTVKVEFICDKKD